MVLSNTTIETINYIKDVEYEYNIKLLLLAFFLITAIISLYLGYKDKFETQSKSLFNLMLIGYGYLVIIFLPLYSIFLYRSVPVDTIFNYLFIAYNIIFWGAFMILLLWFFEVVLNWLFGVSFIDKKKKHRTETEYRKTERD